MLMEVEAQLCKTPDKEQFLLLLREVNGVRFMVFSVHDEALNGIIIALFDLSTERPATHAAWAKMTFDGHIVLEKFVIDMIDDKDQLVCFLHFRQGTHRWKVECRPSDGIALALHLDAPLMCRDSLFTVLSADTSTNPKVISAEEYKSRQQPAEDGAKDDMEERLRVYSTSHPKIPQA